MGNLLPGPEAFTVFVYGTLKEGFNNHANYCRGVTTVVPAHTWGRLYVWEPGIPILAVPRRKVLMLGSPGIAGDLEAAARLSPRPGRRSLWMRPQRRWKRIQGELLGFPDPEQRLRVLDALEGFSPDAGSRYSYQRVLVPVRMATRERGDHGVRAAWTYVLPADEEPPGPALEMLSWEPGQA